MADFTIGTGGDYATLALWRAANRNTAEIQNLTLLEDIVLTAEFRIFQNEFTGGVFVRPTNGMEFHADFDEPNIRTISAGPGLNGTIMQFDTTITFEDIAIFGGTTRPIAHDGGSVVNLNRCGIYAALGSITIQLPLNADINLTDTVVISKVGTAIYTTGDGGNVVASNCIFEGNSDDGAVRQRFGSTTVTNCIVRNMHATGLDIRNQGGTLTVNNCATTDTTGSPASLQNQSVGDWYTDEAGRDYSINTVGQGVLTGSGQAGSNIAQHFWFVPSNVIDASVASTIPAITSSSAIAHSVPGFSASIVSTFPSLTSQSTFSHAAPVYEANILSTIPSINSSLSASHAVPVYSASISSTIPSLTSQSAFVHAPSINSSAIISTIPSITSASALSHDEPVNISASITSTLPSITSTTTIFNGVLVDVVGIRNNINAVVQSRNIDAVSLSRTIIGNE